MKTKFLVYSLTSSGLLLVLGSLSWFVWMSLHPVEANGFNGERALKDVKAQVAFGARTPDSPAHLETIQYIQNELKNAGWTSELLEQSINGHTAYNIYATRSLNNPVILLGAHYDSRIYADNDPNEAFRTRPVPGANDGASGVAVLLELARDLPTDEVPTGLLFIDIEDNGHIPGWDWIQGSKVFADQLTFQPKAVVILDMIGDANLDIYKERNSDVGLTNQIWNTAKTLGYESTFIPEFKYTVLDDHIPFIQKGLRAVDIIDLDYPYWHTTQDTPDKVSASSLKIVGDTLLAWIQTDGTCLLKDNCAQ